MDAREEYPTESAADRSMERRSRRRQRRSFDLNMFREAFRVGSWWLSRAEEHYEICLPVSLEADDAKSTDRDTQAAAWQRPGLHLLGVVPRLAHALYFLDLSDLPLGERPVLISSSGVGTGILVALICFGCYTSRWFRLQYLYKMASQDVSSLKSLF